jgi:hypothetical protein
LRPRFTISEVERRLAVLALGIAALAAFLASRRRSAAQGANGGRERTEQLRREIEEARRRLRDDLARSRGE